MKNILKGAALFLAVLMMGSVLYLSLFGDTTYAAVSVGSSQSPIEVEVRKNGDIKKILDPSGSIDPKDWEGKKMETFIPILVEHSNNSSGSEINISSTYPKEDQGILKRIVAEIQKNSKKTGVILLDGDLKEYKEAKDKNESLNSYLVKSETFYVWNDEDARNKTPEEKRSQLGSKAFYYQTNDDLNRRNELKKQKEKQIAEKKRAEEEKKAAEKKAAEEKAAQEQRRAQQKQENDNNSRRAAPAPIKRQPSAPSVPRRQQTQRRAPQQNRRQVQSYDYDDDDDDDDDDWDD